MHNFYSEENLKKTMGLLAENPPCIDLYDSMFILDFDVDGKCVAEFSFNYLSWRLIEMLASDPNFDYE